MSQKKNEGILLPTEIRVVGSYTDRLLNCKEPQTNMLKTQDLWIYLTKNIPSNRHSEFCKAEHPR